ncbi:MAG: ABC transporter permease [Clostridia bacterium]|nr:ABC transporter permease [Clostridia bacterium]
MPLLKNLVAKDFKIKYRRSILGVAWSVLNPLFTMLVLTIVFKVILRVKVGPGVDFATYYIVGASLWNFFSEATSTSLSSILTSGALIRKVYIPKYIFPLEKCVFALVNFSFSLVAVLAVMLIRGVYPTWATLLFPIPVIYCFIFACGLSLFLSAVTVYFRDVQHLYGVLLTMWIYLTPILYSTETLEQLAPSMQFVKYILYLNPMTHYINYFRAVVMYGVYGDLPSIEINVVCIAMSLAMLGFGALVFKKAEGKFILHL